MYYYDLEDFAVKKYMVEIDEEKLEQLRKKIIDNCSYTVSKSYEIVNSSSICIDSKYIKNYKIKPTNVIDFKTKQKFINVTYDVCKTPYLVILINRLLSKDLTVISQIINYQEKFSKAEMLEFNQKMLYIKSNQKNLSDSEKIRLLKEMENRLLIEEQKLSRRNVLMKKYCLQVLACLNINLIDTILLSDLLKVKNFFEQSEDCCLNKDLQKIIKNNSTKEEVEYEKVNILNQ